jgi:hypothetical protein
MADLLEHRAHGHKPANVEIDVRRASPIACRRSPRCSDIVDLLKGHTNLQTGFAMKSHLRSAIVAALCPFDAFLRALQRQNMSNLRIYEPMPEQAHCGGSLSYRRTRHAEKDPGSLDA